MAPGVASRARTPQTESTQDWGSPGSSAAAPPLPKGPRRRSRGATPPSATQAGIPNRRPRLLLDPARLTCGARRAASAGVEGTCAASRTGFRPPPPRRQARAAHLDARDCRNRGLEGAASSQRPRRTQVRRARLRGTSGCRCRRPSHSRVPETRPSAPAPGEEPPAAGHHERQQRQHHLCQSQAAEARAENVSVRSASSVRGLGAQARGCGRRPHPAPKSPRSGDQVHS